MDEAVFYVSGTKSKTWAVRGKGAAVLSKASRKSKKVFGAITVEDNPHFHFRFANIFNGKSPKQKKRLQTLLWIMQNIIFLL
jgi:hypothetical protein